MSLPRTAPRRMAGPAFMAARRWARAPLLALAGVLILSALLFRVPDSGVGATTPVAGSGDRSPGSDPAQAASTGSTPASGATPSSGPHARTAAGPDLAGLFPRRASFAYEPPEPGSYALPAIKPVPAASLLDHEGRPQSLQAALTGRLSLVSFIYLNCADAQACPLAMATLDDIYQTSARRPTLREHLQLVTISFDPARDTPEALAIWHEVMQADRAVGSKLPWRLFTGASVQGIQPVLEGFGQPVQPAGTPGQFNHLLRMYLVDREAQIRNVYGLGTIDPRLIMTDVQTLLMGERGPQ